ncbi:hypothetical protein DVU_2458 [Nitratidesulfovibrio vulgaris str. Hildenborough]|uniref:Uncharacterized protein n=1 Tax=Nitratidesulfovibrio vulgaris (strain ATCC 29579 / DSM 644 / CCUG 34227 / NCIMB 8303 / VKM B-1760 / Hildenborough) TaxID=882 RepID=Q728Z4_NITV2|nr:hypothetical protein DVU_2458 [Nitratidesulfovibrio vulgaris str. Hildenborough]
MSGMVGHNADGTGSSMRKRVKLVLALRKLMGSPRFDDAFL